MNLISILMFILLDAFVSFSHLIFTLHRLGVIRGIRNSNRIIEINSKNNFFNNLGSANYFSKEFLDDCNCDFHFIVSESCTILDTLDFEKFNKNENLCCLFSKSKNGIKTVDSFNQDDEYYSFLNIEKNNSSGNTGNIGISLIKA
jgi:hypothetical protein